jgi:hypothetical protein
MEIAEIKHQNELKDSNGKTFKLGNLVRLSVEGRNYYSKPRTDTLMALLETPDDKSLTDEEANEVAMRSYTGKVVGFSLDGKVKVVYEDFFDEKNLEDFTNEVRPEHLVIN